MLFPQGRIHRAAPLALAVALWCGRPATAVAQDAATTALQRRADQIVALFRGEPLGVDTIFSAPFLAQVPAARLHTVMAQISTAGHGLQSVKLLRTTPGMLIQGVFELDWNDGHSSEMTVGVNTTSSNLVELFVVSTRSVATFADLAKEFHSLPGHVSFLAAEVVDHKLVPVAAVDSGAALGIGSAFKLYVLAELLREIAAGKRHWNEVVTLDPAIRSLPSGVLQTWPTGTPMTVQALASMMISQSDNTAADWLLHLVGREKVEAIMAPAGNSHASRNMPFLSTREMFGLKSAAGADARADYLTGNTAVRRAALARVDAIPYAQIAPEYAGGPVEIDSIEWFASAADLGRTLLWLRDQSTSGAPATARGILAINPATLWAPDAWSYVGFKGGSEPGVLSLNYLLQRADGRWFVLTGTWNNPAKAVDDVSFAALMKRAGELLEAPATKP
ncbi:MAG TPA: serine hydrolase [Gemmatimonadales bacterium]|jgi:hypothetical protein